MRAIQAVAGHRSDRVRAFGGGKVDKLDVGDATHLATAMRTLTRAEGCGGAVPYSFADTPRSTPSLRVVLVH
ncbi:MAG: hypothetical protein NVSMB47_04580 [Polyangiales bacterium]